MERDKEVGHQWVRGDNLKTGVFRKRIYNRWDRNDRANKWLKTKEISIGDNVVEGH